MDTDDIILNIQAVLHLSFINPLRSFSTSEFVSDIYSLLDEGTMTLIYKLLTITSNDASKITRVLLRKVSLT